MRKKLILSIIIFSVAIVTSSCNIIDKNQVSTQNKVMKTNNELADIFNEYEFTLDGANAESYAYELYDIYKKSDVEQFINILSECDINRICGIIDLLVGEILNSEGNEGSKKLETTFESFKKNTKLNRKEKYIVYEVLARILYFEEALNFKE